MAHIASHLYSRNEIKQNAALIKNIFLKFGVKIKTGHALEASSLIAGYKNWDSASSIAPNEGRDVTIVIGRPGSGKTTFIQNAIDMDENTLVIDYNGEYLRESQTFGNAHIVQLREEKDANFIIKILPSFSRVVLENGVLIFTYYPELFGHIVYGNLSAIITDTNKHSLAAAGIAFNIKPETYITVHNQSINVYKFSNPFIGRKEYEQLSPYEALLANMNHPKL